MTQNQQQASALPNPYSALPNPYGPPPSAAGATSKLTEEQARAEEKNTHGTYLLNSIYPLL